jgi:hypothetical protein
MNGTQPAEASRNPNFSLDMLGNLVDQIRTQDRLNWRPKVIALDMNSLMKPGQPAPV